MTDRVLLERHLLASSADAYDAAWRTFAVSPGLAGEASRLESAVPWGVATAEAEDPPRLDLDPGDPTAATAHDRLNVAFYPLPPGGEPRLAYSVWGAVGRRVGRLNRVATHTVVMPRRAFPWLAGHPSALVAEAGRPAPWVPRLAGALGEDGPARLEPFRLEGPGAARGFERDRRREVARLRDRVLDALAGDRAGLARRLGAIYEALAVVVAGGAGQVALRGDGDAMGLLARLAWLGLPLADRVRVPFTTEAPEAGAGGWALAVVTDRGAPPDGTLLLEEGAFGAPRKVSRGRMHWSKLVVLASEPRDPAGRGAGTGADLVDSYPRLSARLDARGGSILDSAAVERALDIERWRESGRHDLDGALRVVALETGRGPGEGAPRLRAAGRLLAEAIPGASAGQDPAALLDRIEAAVGRRDRSARLLRGTLRRIRDLDPMLLAELRVGAVRRGLAPADTLALLAGPERRGLDALLDADDGPVRLLRELAAAASGGWADDGPVTLAAVDRLGRPADGIAAARSVDPTTPEAADWARVFLLALESRWPDRYPDPRLLDDWLVPVLDAPRAGDAARRLRGWLDRPAVAVAYAGAPDRLEPWLTRVRPAPATVAGAAALSPVAAPSLVAGLAAVGRGDEAVELLERAIGSAGEEVRRSLVDAGPRMPARWLARQDVLELLLDRATGLGDRVLDVLLGTLLAGGVALGDREAELVLRHLWRRDDGGDGPIRRLAADAPRNRSIPVLVRLLEAVPPPGQYLRVRAALDRLVTRPALAGLGSADEEALGRIAPGLLPVTARERRFLLADGRTRETTAVR